MANDITSNPWVINTVPFTSGTILKVKVDNLDITDAGATDNILIKDLNGKTLVNWTANASQTSYRIGKLGWVNGIVVATGGLGTAGTAVVTISVGAGK